MRNLMLLLRVQLLALANSLSPMRAGGKQRKTGTRIILTLAAVFLLAGIAVVYMLGLGVSLAMAGLSGTIPVFAVLFGSLAGVVFTFMKANGTLFGMTDYDLVMSLPFPRRTVVASRMAALFCSAIALGAVFMVPLYAVFFSFEGASPLGLLAAVLSVPLAPAVPTSIAIAASFALTALAGRFRHANLVYIAFALLALTASVIGSYGFSFSLQTGTNGNAAATLTTMGALAGTLQEGIANIYPPAGLMASAITAENMPALVVFIALSLAVPALCLEIMQRNYLAINGILASRGGRGRDGAKAALTAAERATSPFKTLVIKELRTQIGIPSYAINCLFGYLLMLALSVALTVADGRSMLESGILNSGTIDSDSFVLHMTVNQVFLLIPWFFAFCAVASPTAAVAISLEGRSAWLMATAPVSAKTILGAKLAANAVPMATVLIASNAILLAGGQVVALGAAESLLVGFGMFYLLANIGMLIDARRPNFAWSTAREVVKYSAPIMASVMGGMLAVFVLGGITMVLAFSVGDAAAHAFALASGAISLAGGYLIFRHTCTATAFQVA